MESQKTTVSNFWKHRLASPSNEHVSTSLQATSAVTLKRSFFISVSSTVLWTATERTFDQTTTIPKMVADVSTDPCKSFPCYNNGTCLATSRDNFTCRCTKEWMGSLCLANFLLSSLFDDSDGCLKTSAHQNIVQASQIFVPVWRSGNWKKGNIYGVDPNVTAHVVENPNFCRDDPCKNGGKCGNGNSYTICQCPQNYTGEFCQHFCPIDMCLNGGKCKVNGRNLYSCECRTGWTGARCQLNINECASNPCKIGQCIDRINGYICMCPRGLMGSKCHTLRKEKQKAIIEDMTIVSGLQMNQKL
uniref:EGF-like domain-containing protein n=1 Tax=Romanomermis culicivorax TaxID=13658 RepID=A0A915HVD7_ROMCU